MRQTLLTSPLFVPSTLLTLNSPVTNPNAIDLRFTFKALVIGPTHLINLEFLPDFEGFVDLWIALFGTGDEFVAARISRHYWDYDWKIVSSRRAIFDVTRSRFPVQFKPLVRLLHSMCGTGNTREFGDKNDDDRTLCATYVYHYFLNLPTFTQVIPITARSGPNAVYEALINELYSGGAMYRNTHTISFPGGSVLPRGSSSRLLSSITDPNDPIIVEWEHQYSGWKLLLAVLRNYIKRAGTDRSSLSSDAEHRRDISLTLCAVGMEDTVSDETIIDALELIRCVIDKNSDLAAELMQGLESGDTASEPDLVEVTIRILEDALQRSTNPRISPPSKLIISATGVLTALISLPVYAYRVWPFFRSNHTLFGNDNHAPITPSLLA
ncbi:hypothetical protein Clacol_003455 [Clathrus columnatus]|uniref:Nucleoporin Nup188 N-terminal subdomain III domain-containing protein n=1 Tax=Clathrus columnatus TaxID=1419009 RepID=A0AAV5A7P1_9AGAM|nr:hypothetical protein Clacol_003455 [Clathrus columnatus]